jgi:hypothetical protein
MTIESTQRRKNLAILLLAYGVASLVHFMHNAEFLHDYPGLPRTWTHEGVYFAWMAMTAVGLAGWFLATRGYAVVGLLALAAVLVLVEVARQLAARAFRRPEAAR